MSKYGQNDILTPIVNDIHTLADGKPVELFCAVMSSLGDTEGQHQWGGFKVKVGWSHHCWSWVHLLTCSKSLGTVTSQKEIWHSTITTAAILKQHQTMRQGKVWNTYGITERSLLNRLPTFDVTMQLPQDLMHMLLGGSVQYEVRYILQNFIDNGFITLKQLSSCKVLKTYHFLQCCCNEKIVFKILMLQVPYL